MLTTPGSSPRFRAPLAASPLKGRLSSFLALPILILLSLLLVARPVLAQVVAGQVLDATTGDSVPLAEVTLLDTAGTALRTVLADRAGYFTLSPAAGRYALRATALGYDTARTRQFEVDASEAMQVQLSLGVRALELAPLTVVARQRDMRWRDLHEYYGRIERHRRLHIGWIVTREDLEPVQVWKFTEFLSRAAPIGFITGLHCRPALYWDGIYQMQPPGAPSPLENVSLRNIEGIEFYRNFGPADIRFSDPNGCGVILVWSRPLTDARTATLRNVLAAVGGFVAAVFVTHWLFGLPLRIF
jgi:hypothetical protein